MRDRTVGASQIADAPVAASDRDLAEGKASASCASLKLQWDSARIWSMFLNMSSSRGGKPSARISPRRAVQCWRSTARGVGLACTSRRRSRLFPSRRGADHGLLHVRAVHAIDDPVAIDVHALLLFEPMACCPALAVNVMVVVAGVP
eukprot:CAMPEP_0117605026 /NCGR_PEP_ID=MMETSP0784-20121206/78985_1 /TAXON_ID=39447 /ORGANISM="" /LENGTH=146 /DNA_ID=CAMNT_0005408065 /DNA_START=154 /DNA_END=594 /DNA_ORIENTATION=+